MAKRSGSITAEKNYYTADSWNGSRQRKKKRQIISEYASYTR